MRSNACTMLLLAASLLVAACAPRGEHLPTVQFRDEREAREILARRADDVRTMTAQGLITLTRPDGESVRFDLVMARDRDQGVRLRAWKLGRAVFDLTMTPQGVWLLTPDDPSLKLKVRQAGLSAKQLLETWNLFDREAFRSGTGGLTDDGRVLIYEEDSFRSTIDRHTLTPIKYTLHDEQARERFELLLEDYRAISGIPVAHRYTARSDGGTIRIVLREVELNADLAPNALRPPRRAEKLP